jgi:hypothetical protein
MTYFLKSHQSITELCGCVSDRLHSERIITMHRTRTQEGVRLYKLRAYVSRDDEVCSFRSAQQLDYADFRHTTVLSPEV